MRPIRTYSISVDGYGSGMYSARSASKARAAAYRDFLSACEITFKEFLQRSSLMRVADPPGVGKRVLIGGEPATTVYGHSSQYVWWMRDDSDVRLCSHPLDVEPLPALSLQEGKSDG